MRKVLTAEEADALKADVNFRRVIPPENCETCAHRDGLLCAASEPFHLSFILCNWVCDRHAKKLL